MYRATINDREFFNTQLIDEAFALINPKINLEVGKAGSFTFEIYPSNIEYNSIEPLIPIIKVYRKERLIFAGRVFDYVVGFNNEKIVTCEGMLSIFNDSAQPPFNFNGTIPEFVTKILENHNNQVDEKKKVKLGSVTVTDANDYIARSKENYIKTINLLDDTAKSLGGYFILRIEDDGYYLDFIADYLDECKQTIDFGENLLDLSQELVAEDLITAIIPIGSDIEDKEEDGTVSRRKLTVASVNEGRDIIVDEEASKKYGLIVGIKEWQDVTRPENLKAKAIKELAMRIRGSVSIKITAADLAAVNNDIEGFLCGDYVNIISSQHKISERMLIKKHSIDLLNPGNSKLSMGDTRLGFVSSSIQDNSQYKDVISKIESNYATNESVTESNHNINTVKVDLESKINQTAQDIELKVSEIYATNESVNDKYTSLKVDVDGIAAEVKSLDGIKLAVRVSENGIEIGKSDSEIKSVQDNKSYKFVDKSNTTLLELNAKGVNAPAVNVTKQLRIGESWAIRHGKYIDRVGYNLNDTWIGE